VTNDRARRLGAALAAANLGWAVLTDYDAVAHATDLDVPIDIGPLFQVGGPDVTVLDADGATTLVVPDIRRAAAQRCRADEVVVYETSHDGASPEALLRTVTETLDRVGVRGRVGVQPASLPYALGCWLAEHGAEPVGVDDVLRAVRLVKDAEELDRLRRCAELTSAAQRRALTATRPGVTELAAFAEIALEWEIPFAGRTAVTGDFLSGVERTAGVLGRPTDRMMCPGDPVIVDLAPRVGNYWGDSANTLFLGEPDAAFRRMHTAVRDALHRGIEAIRPGWTAGQADELIRAEVRAAGYDYPHHTGHSVGTASHEFPCIRPGAEAVLVEDMVLLLEPGAYRPESGGVRLEWMFHLTADGLVPLSSFDHVLSGRNT
jgi:Xaa-Pro dipeptidase